MGIAVLVIGALLIVGSAMVAGHRAGVFVSTYFLRLPPDLGAWAGLLIGLALAAAFLWKNVPLTS